MKTFYAHFGSDGVNRVLAEGIEPPVLGERAIWTREHREKLGRVHDCELVDGEIRLKRKALMATPAPRFDKRKWLIRAAQAAALAGSFLAGYLV